MSRAGRQWLGYSLAILTILVLYRHIRLSNAPNPPVLSPPSSVVEGPLPVDAPQDGQENGSLLPEPVGERPPDDPTQPFPSPNEPENQHENEPPITLWSAFPEKYPVHPDFMPPLDALDNLLPIQADSSEFPKSTGWIFSDAATKTREERQAAVKAAFVRCWSSYKSLAWDSDELAPVTGVPRNELGGWGMTLVDNLDTLWIMGLYKEFDEAVDTVAQTNFEQTHSNAINTYEVNIHILGGLLGAYDLSDDHRLLKKAIEVGDVLYAAFDTPNRMPVIHWDMNKAARREGQEAEEDARISEVGSFILEFTRLSQLTDNPKYFDAALFLTEKFQRLQSQSLIPGLWPSTFNARGESVAGDHFTMGAEVDSLYKTFSKAFVLLGGRMPVFREMYDSASRDIAGRLLFRPFTREEVDVLLPGAARVVHLSNSIGNFTAQRTYLETPVHHRSCFAGGMFAMGSSLFDIPAHQDIAHKLVDGCLWAARSAPLGIMPETIEPISCQTQKSCPWSEEHWQQEVERRAKIALNVEQVADLTAFIESTHLFGGLVSVPDIRHNLRPELIESIFILYRVTAREDLLNSAWEIFEAIQKATEVSNGNAAMADVTDSEADPSHLDVMDSAWMAQTLKYSYLIYGSPDTLSLDHYVFNSGGHPFRRPEPNAWGV